MSYVFQFIVANGVSYVNWPKLVPLPHVPVSPFAAKVSQAKAAVGLKQE